MTNSANDFAKTWEKPRLVTLGSVRNLTGGTLDVATDTGFAAGKQANNGGGTSERRLKENIAKVDTHPLGFGLYLFDYKAEFADHGDGRQFGVMVDEVEPIVPEAITLGEDGFKRVNYAMLGITRH